MRRTPPPTYQKVRRMIAYADAHPRAYRRSLRAWAVLGAVGYALLALAAAGLVLMPLITLWLVGKAVWNGFALAIGGWSLHALVAALLTRDEPTEITIRVVREDAPGLWEEADRIVARLGAPPIDEIALTLDHNASVGRQSRFLLWGRGQSVLSLGLPLLLSADVGEMRAVLAHELGHHRAGHVGETLRTMRVALALVDVGQRFESGGGIPGFLLRPIVSLYVPRMILLALPTRRDHEIAADRAVVELGLAREMRRCLLRDTTLIPWYLSAFLSHRPTYAALAEGMRRPRSTEELADAIAEELRDASVTDDAHPKLAERLSLLTGDATVEDDAETLATEARTHEGDWAMETLFAPEFLVRVEGFANDLFEFLSDGSLSDTPDAPPTPLETARARAASEGPLAARGALLAVATNPEEGAMNRLEATLALGASRASEGDFATAVAALASDPYVGLNALALQAAALGTAFQQGTSEDGGARAREITESVERETASLAEFAAAVRKHPALVIRQETTVPPDVIRALAEAAEPLLPVRRVWALWASHPRAPRLVAPLAVLDAGVEFRSFKLTLDDPKLLATHVRREFASPAGFAVLVGWSHREIEAIVGEREPVWARGGTNAEERADGHD